MAQHAGRLAQWFAAHAPAMKLYARQWMDASTAEDAVHDVFVRLLAKGIEPHEPKAWLFAAVRNAAISTARSGARRKRRDARVSETRGEWFEARIDDLVDASGVTEAMESLPQASREIVVLRVWGEMSFAEIGQLIGVPVSSVFDRYRASLSAMREKMESQCKTKTT